jgi:hypothetical protein
VLGCENTLNRVIDKAVDMRKRHGHAVLRLSADAEMRYQDIKAAFVETTRSKLAGPRASCAPPLDSPTQPSRLESAISPRSPVLCHAPLQMG